MTDNHLRLVEPPEVADDEDDGDGDSDLLVVEASYNGSDDVIRMFRLIADADVSDDQVADYLITAIRSVAMSAGGGLAVALDQRLMSWGRT